MALHSLLSRHNKLEFKMDEQPGLKGSPVKKFKKKDFGLVPV